MSSLNLNKVVLCGRLTADPELKQTTSGIAVVSFTLAVNRRFQAKGADGAPAQQQADFISVVAWRQTAEFISRYFRKGSALCITGVLAHSLPQIVDFPSLFYHMIPAVVDLCLKHEGVQLPPEQPRLLLLQYVSQ